MGSGLAAAQVVCYNGGSPNPVACPGNAGVRIVVTFEVRAPNGEPTAADLMLGYDTTASGVDGEIVCDTAARNQGICTQGQVNSGALVTLTTEEWMYRTFLDSAVAGISVKSQRKAHADTAKNENAKPRPDVGPPS